ncbi:hypothetical protein PAAG_04898 [Paracoccidioides lutzii Pb01]|uniref:Uncharacterized protein n=1 Tax=Paracoccidioides lutzii (strain ATCC MYA-826 / Pb01) TaxID=502779 RepID=C1H1W2_PARBA|nr:hypothetical protein PAAG_04898 [Paracoccidioides lutzii Pb01]EEH33849.2 hypothetical protein PAAG_04898 [Paracoccidioides lutzii Pb01]
MAGPFRIIISNWQTRSGSRKTGLDEVDHMHYHRTKQPHRSTYCQSNGSRARKGRREIRPLQFAPNFDEVETQMEPEGKLCQRTLVRDLVIRGGERV